MIPLLSELRFCKEKKEGYFCPQKCVKNKKFECGYLILIKKFIFLKSCKNQIDFIKSNFEINVFYLKNYTPRVKLDQNNIREVFLFYYFHREKSVLHFVLNFKTKNQ